MAWSLFNSDKKKQKGADEAARQAAIRAGKKGKATPKRKEAQSMSYVPLVPDPKDRKAHQKVERARIRARQDKEYEAMERGDVSHMPAAERDPMRIYVRQWIDARWNISEWFMPAALLLLIVSFAFTSVNPMVAYVLAIAMYVYMLLVVIDLIVMWVLLKKSMREHGYKTDRESLKSRRIGSYAISRALQVRRWRMPKPTNKHGQWPEH